MTIIVVPERKHCPVQESVRDWLSYKAEKGAAVSLAVPFSLFQFISVNSFYICLYLFILQFILQFLPSLLPQPYPGCQAGGSCRRCQH